MFFIVEHGSTHSCGLLNYIILNAFGSKQSLMTSRLMKRIKLMKHRERGKGWSITSDWKWECFPINTHRTVLIYQLVGAIHLGILSQKQVWIFLHKKTCFSIYMIYLVYCTLRSLTVDIFLLLISKVWVINLVFLLHFYLFYIQMILKYSI